MPAVAGPGAARCRGSGAGTACERPSCSSHKLDPQSRSPGSAGCRGQAAILAATPQPLGPGLWHARVFDATSTPQQDARPQDRRAEPFERMGHPSGLGQGVIALETDPANGALRGLRWRPAGPSVQAPIGAGRPLRCEQGTPVRRCRGRSLLPTVSRLLIAQLPQQLHAKPGISGPIGPCCAVTIRLPLTRCRAACAKDRGSAFGEARQGSPTPLGILELGSAATESRRFCRRRRLLAPTRHQRTAPEPWRSANPSSTPSSAHAAQPALVFLWGPGNADSTAFPPRVS